MFILILKLCVWSDEGDDQLGSQVDLYKKQTKNEKAAIMVLICMPSWWVGWSWCDVCDYQHSWCYQSMHAGGSTDRLDNSSRQNEEGDLPDCVWQYSWCCGYGLWKGSWSITTFSLLWRWIVRQSLHEESFWGSQEYDLCRIVWRPNLLFWIAWQIQFYRSGYSSRYLLRLWIDRSSQEGTWNCGQWYCLVCVVLLGCNGCHRQSPWKSESLYYSSSIVGFTEFFIAWIGYFWCSWTRCQCGGVRSQ